MSVLIASGRQQYHVFSTIANIKGIASHINGSTWREKASLEGVIAGEGGGGVVP